MTAIDLHLIAHPGAPATPIFPRLVGLFEWYYQVPATTDGVICASCCYWLDGKRHVVRHVDVQGVRDCHSLAQEAEAEARAEQAAERRNERFWEDRGGYDLDEEEWYRSRPFFH